MKTLLAMVTILLTANAVLAGDIDLYSFTMENGDLYSFSIDRALYDKQPVIELGQQEAPLPPGKAAAIAHDAIRNLVPAEYFSRLKCGAMTIRQIPNPDDSGAGNSKRWIVPRRDNREESRALDFTIIAGELGRGTVGL